jgi:hypothetical protein
VSGSQGVNFTKIFTKSCFFEGDVIAALHTYFWQKKKLEKSTHKSLLTKGLNCANILRADLFLGLQLKLFVLWAYLCIFGKMKLTKRFL